MRWPGWGWPPGPQASQHAFGGEARLAEADLSGSRFGIWSNTLAMIRQQPWAGVGFGEFNLAWSLTPFPGPAGGVLRSHAQPAAATGGGTGPAAGAAGAGLAGGGAVARLALEPR